MFPRTIQAATICAALLASTAALAGGDMPAKSGTPVTPSAGKAEGPTGKTGSADPKAAGTPVAPTKGNPPTDTAH